MNKPKTLNATRYRVTDDRGRHVYVTICTDPVTTTPLEIWVTVPEENKAPERNVRTAMTMIATLFTEAREGGVPYSKLYKAMQGACYSKASLPAKMLRLLAMHCPLEKAERREFESRSQNEKEREQCLAVAEK